MPDPDVTRIKIDIPFKGDEEARYRKYLEDTGRSRSGGPWVRTLILKALDEEARREGKAS